MLQVEVVVALENRLAKTFESLSLLDASVVLALHSIARCQLLLSFADSLRVSLERLTHRVFHYLAQFVGERLQPLVAFSQAWLAIGVFPFIRVFLDLLFKLLCLLSFEFSFQLNLSVRKVHGLLNRQLVIPKAIEEVLIDILLLLGVGFGPLFRCLCAVLGLNLLLPLFSISISFVLSICGFIFLLILLAFVSFVLTLRTLWRSFLSLHRRPTSRTCLLCLFNVLWLLCSLSDLSLSCRRLWLLVLILLSHF